MLESLRNRAVVPMGSAFPSPTLFPLQKLASMLSNSARQMDPWSTVEGLPGGNAELRRQISRRYLRSGATVSPDEIIVTGGALEALNLSLQSLTRPGDLVAIESPAFYGCLQAVESLGLKAIEIPTHPTHGVDLAYLARVLDKHSVRACWFMTSFQNPLGALMSDAAREELVQMLQSHDVSLIEDDVYSELYFGTRRPKSTKAFDRTGLVLNCGSFSKCLAPGYRIGWVAAGRFARSRAAKAHELVVHEYSGARCDCAVFTTGRVRSSPWRFAADVRRPAENDAASLTYASAAGFYGHSAGRWLRPMARISRARRCHRCAQKGPRSGVQRRARADLFGTARICPLSAAQLRP